MNCPILKKLCILSGVIVLSLFSCKTDSKKSQNETDMKEKQHYLPGTFGYDLMVLEEKQELIVLKSDDEKSQVILSADFQGRIMTSTLSGMDGFSMGWINHDLIRSGEIQEHINAYGGEDRIWFGPEGGQFSVFFKPDVPFEFEHWQTPKEIDTEPFKVVEYDNISARFEREMNILNYSGTRFDLLVNRNISMLNREDLNRLLGITVSESIGYVGIESENIITNTGDFAWTKETGMLSIWILGIFNPSPATTIVIPFRRGDEAQLGRVVNDEYFGKVPADRLITGDSVLYFKGDGKFRSKIGLNPLRARPIAGSYDEERQLLTIVHFSLPEGITDYVNSMWELQDDPFSGDAVNSYNDGPLEDGGQMGPFYELESSSPAATLSPGERLVHYHRTLHFSGPEQDLDYLARALLGVDIQSIKAVF
jgi:hypothetical protein